MGAAVALGAALTVGDGDLVCVGEWCGDAAGCGATRSKWLPDSMT